MESFARFRRLSNWHQRPVAGVTRSEIMILHCIRELALPDDLGPKISELSGLLNVAAPTITQQINALEAAGLVEKNSDPTDRRAVRIRLTAHGATTLQAGHAAILASFEGLVAYLGEEESDHLANLLGKMALYFSEIRGATPEPAHQAERIIDA